MKMRSRIGRNLNLCFSKTMTRPESPPCTYTTSSSSSTSKICASTSSDSASVYEYDDIDMNMDSSEPKPADVANAFASQRFFFSTPGHSNSIIQSSSSSSPVQKQKQKQRHSYKQSLLIRNSVAVSTDSPDPFTDFRRSMQEMVEAHPQLTDPDSDDPNWEMLHQLLLCYLSLNPNNTHNFILAAFAHLLLTLNSDEVAAATGDAGC